MRARSTGSKPVARHVVARAEDVPPGARISVNVDGTPVAIFNLGGEFFGLLDKCPHMGGMLSEGVLIGLVEAPRPGCYAYQRRGEIVRCPWHGWEFDIRTGKSRFDPDRWRARSVDVDVATLDVKDATRIDVAQDGDVIVVNL